MSSRQVARLAPLGYGSSPKQICLICTIERYFGQLECEPRPEKGVAVVRARKYLAMSSWRNPLSESDISSLLANILLRIAGGSPQEAASGAQSHNLIEREFRIFNGIFQVRAEYTGERGARPSSVIQIQALNAQQRLSMQRHGDTRCQAREIEWTIP